MQSSLISFYMPVYPGAHNATRRHSTLGMLSPARYEERHSLEQLKDDHNN
jgi:hypothetical protein